ncbi:MAG: hypothetical protein ACM3JI_01340 [Anaerolineae bacterium]
MSTVVWTVCSAFLNQLPPSKKEALLKHLPHKRSQQLTGYPLCESDPTKGFESLDVLLERVHYSWFAPFLRTLPENDIRLFVSSLSLDQIEGLKATLLFSNHFLSLAPLAKTFLQSQLFDKILEKEFEFVPLSCLPKSPLNELITIEDKLLFLLIDFLGLRDLSSEIRQIIETSKLKQIYGALSQEKQRYLKVLLQKKEPVIFKKMGLERWNGDAKVLETALHQRGLNRLAKALYEQHPSLVWMVSHRLEISKGLLLQKLLVPLEHKSAAPILTLQIIELAAYLKHRNPLLQL